MSMLTTVLSTLVCRHNMSSVDATGYMIYSDQPYNQPHRHYR